MIQFRCTCGKLLQVKDEHAGMQVACPACKASLQVPYPRAQAIEPQAVLAPVPAPAPPGQDQYDPEGPPRRRHEGPRTSGKAIASLILGIGTFCIPVLLGIPAVILGILARGDVKRSRGAVTGGGMALAGIICGGAGSLTAILYYFVIVGAVTGVRESAAKAASQNNLRQLALAVHSHHDNFKSMPPAAICAKDGTPLLSWRVAILPYIEGGTVFQMFRRDEPWDSPHNIRLLNHMPPIFAPVKGNAPPHHTHYQLFTGPNTLFPTPASKGRIPGTFKDGTSNTFLIVEAAEAVPWTKPADVEVRPGQPLPRLGGQFPGKFLVVMGDASTRLLRTDLPDPLLRQLIDPKDGQPLPPDWER